MAAKQAESFSEFESSALSSPETTGDIQALKELSFPTDEIEKLKMKYDNVWDFVIFL